MAESFGLMFELFEEVLADDLEQQQVLLGADDEAVLFLLAAGQLVRKEHVRTKNFYEITVPSYIPEDFRSHFRMSRHTVTVLEHLLSVHGDLPQYTGDRGRPPVELRKQILITLWILGNPECLRSVADRFDVCRATAYRVYRRVCKAIVRNLMDEFIKFPTGLKAQAVMEAFEEKKGFPGVLGAIDGTHIPIKAPHNNHEQYINRKGFFSVQLQVICDPDLFITDVFCGYPGSVHDARVFRNSPICREVEVNPDNYFPGNSHILGDAAYPLKRWLLTSFRDNGRLTAQQRRYNTAHSSTRMVVERSIGLFKNRFRKLKTMMDVDKIEDIPEIIVSSCILHNICIIEDDIDDFLDDSNDDDDNDDNDDDIFPPGVGAVDKRNMIMRLIP